MSVRRKKLRLGIAFRIATRNRLGASQANRKHWVAQFHQQRTTFHCFGEIRSAAVGAHPDRARPWAWLFAPPPARTAIGELRIDCDATGAHLLPGIARSASNSSRADIRTTLARKKECLA
jgi:hypothetical protein